MSRTGICPVGRNLEGLHNIGEDIADRRAKQGQNYDYDDSDEYENERVLNQTLTFFFRSE
jgi:hypothetical protein